MSDPTEVRVLSPTAILGYGYPPESLAAGLQHRPDVIGVDAGSTDPGPYYLGAGVSFTSADAVQRDLAPLVRAAHDLAIPLIVGSAGGAGADPHVEWAWDILREIARDDGLHLRVAVIGAEQSRETVLRALDAGRISSIASSPNLLADDVDRTARIVAQMGTEPIERALTMGVDVVLAGRSCDTSVFAAVPIARGFDAGLSIHAAKIIECGAYCAEPPSTSDAILASIRRDHFNLRALNPSRRISATSAIAHTLYEQSHPYLITEPLGTTDAGGAVFEELDDGSVNVSRTRFTPAARQTVKLEGAALVGYRAVSIGGIRDADAIRSLDDIFAAARRHVAVLTEGWPEPLGLYLRRYGGLGHEIGIVIEAIGPSQAEAGSLCAAARSAVLHAEFPGRRAAGGNVAFPFSPHDAPWGPVFEFSIYHLMEIDDPLAPFPITIRTT